VSRAAPEAQINDREENSNATRQFLDHRKDKPSHFSVMARPTYGRPSPTHKLSKDYVSMSSESSYASSISSRGSILSSTTDASSVLSASFDERPDQAQGTKDSVDTFSPQLKQLYRTLTNLETKIIQHVLPDRESNTRLVWKEKEDENEDPEKEQWKKQIEDHKQFVSLSYYLIADFSFYLGSLKLSTYFLRLPYRLMFQHPSESSQPNTT
jgi:hypothetical protein